MTARPSVPRAAGIAVVALIALAALIWWQAPANAPPPDAGLEQPAAAGATASPPAATPPAGDTPAASAGLARHDLAADEKRGGHTLARHVGKSDADLIERLRRERGISAASTYTDRATAERVVAETIAQNRTKIDIWIKRQGNRPNLALDYEGRAGESIGRSVKRGSSQSVTCTTAVVVLRWDRARSFYVLTSYPEASR